MVEKKTPTLQENVDRINEMADTEDGWLDGEGEGFSKKEIKWLSTSFEKFYTTSRPLPSTFQMPDHGVQFEWFGENDKLIIEINLNTHLAHLYDFRESLIIEAFYDLDKEFGWKNMCKYIDENLTKDLKVAPTIS